MKNSKINIIPQISVIMSVYKEPIEWLRQSIDSILNQTFSDYEYIIVCDNPSYLEGERLLVEYAKKDERIVLLHNEENIGLTKSLNKALAIAKGKYIVRMDADDISIPNRFEKQYRFMEHNPNVDVCGTAFRFFGDVGVFTGKVIRHPMFHDDIVFKMLFENPLAHPSVIMKRIIRGSAVKYDETCKKGQDYLLWYSLYKTGAIFHNLKDVCLRYRVSAFQISSHGIQGQRETGDGIRQVLLLELLKDSHINPKVFNEICKIKKSNIELDKKLDCLKIISGRMGNKFTLSIESQKTLFYYWTANCLLYGRVRDIKRCPFFSRAFLFDWSILRLFIKSNLNNN